MSSNGDVRPLEQIGKYVYVSEAQPTAVTGCQDTSPQYILVFGWMGGQLPHLGKYLDKYRLLYPNANQILVRSDFSAFFSRAKTRESMILPAVEYLRDGMAQNPTPSLLIHTFSNGGAAQFVQMSRILSRKRVDPPAKPPATCIIIDSAPGKGDIRTALEAFTITIKSRILKAIAYVLLGGFFFLYMILLTLRRKQGPIDELRAQLNNPLILPWTTANTPRLYFYSDTDRLIPHHAVEDHVASAKTIGLNTHAVLFHGSPHVAHARTHPEKYWDTVKSTWAEAWKICNQ